MGTKKKKKSKNQIAFERAANSKIVECQMVSVGNSKASKLLVLNGFRDFVTDEFNKVSAQERAKYEKFLRKKIKNIEVGHPKLKGWLNRILDEYQPDIPEPASE